jgi:putative transcriptional regulator
VLGAGVVAADEWPSRQVSILVPTAAGGNTDLMARMAAEYLQNKFGKPFVVINKPSDINLKNLFDKVDLPLARPDLVGAPVYRGGPVATERGFVLHEAVFAGEDKPEETVYASTMTIPGGLEMTTSKDVLEALSTGAGPRKVLVSLGYAQWGEGQLESEIGENSWLTVSADAAIIFDTPAEQRYDKALALLGLQVWMLSSDAGHA